MTFFPLFFPLCLQLLLRLGLIPTAHNSYFVWADDQSGGDEAFSECAIRSISTVLVDPLLVQPFSNRGTSTRKCGQWPRLLQGKDGPLMTWGMSLMETWIRCIYWMTMKHGRGRNVSDLHTVPENARLQVSIPLSAPALAFGLLPLPSSSSLCLLLRSPCPTSSHCSALLAIIYVVSSIVRASQSPNSMYELCTGSLLLQSCKHLILPSCASLQTYRFHMKLVRQSTVAVTPSSRLVLFMMMISLCSY